MISSSFGLWQGSPEGTTAKLIDEKNFRYLKLEFLDDRLVGAQSVGLTDHVGMLRGLIVRLQGERGLQVVSRAAQHAPDEYKWSEISPGAQNTVQYDTTVRDLVNFLVYMGEPVANSRKRIGILVLFALGILFIFAYALKKEYWKDVK